MGWKQNTRHYWKLGMSFFVFRNSVLGTWELCLPEYITPSGKVARFRGDEARGWKTGTGTSAWDGTVDHVRQG